MVPLSASRLAHCDLGTDHSLLTRQLMETCARLQLLRLVFPTLEVASSSLVTPVSPLPHILTSLGVGLKLGPRVIDSGMPRKAFRGSFSGGDPQSVSNLQSSGSFLALCSLSQVNFSDDDTTRSRLLQNLLRSSCELKTFRYVDLCFH